MAANHSTETGKENSAQGSEGVVEDTDCNQTAVPLFGEKMKTKRSRLPLNGRLMQLDENDISILDKNYTKLIGKGGFGNVYSTEGNSDHEGFGIRIAVKKILHGEWTTSWEIVASRIMHPFVLPLLALIDRPYGNPEVWLVSPLCEKGDLFTAIKNGTVDKIRTRVKILLQIALAIKYFHTNVPNVRDAILHKNIASKKIVLDAHFNARLIDFGLARKDDTLARVGYSHPYFEAMKATESWDYFSFGVIIREMLTSLKPKGEEGPFLKHMRPVDILAKLDKDVWVSKHAAQNLNDIANACLSDLKMDLPEFDKVVVKGIKDVWWKHNMGKIIDIPDGNTKCHICMINPKASETSMTQDHPANCEQKIEACIACEKNSFLNPIKCYCGTDLKPSIGYGWGALLVAGNDQNDPLVAEALTNDVLTLEKLIVSLAPRIMGIRKDKVHTIVPSGKGKQGEEPEKMWPKVKECITIFSKETEVDTLLIYFSCLSEKEVGKGDVFLKLGSVSDSISMGEFETELEKLENIDKLLIILDCGNRYPLNLQFKKMDRKVTQIYACGDIEIADTGNVSSFTKYLIQGLKACSEEKRCPENCQHCKQYWSSRSDLISVDGLFGYVKNHMKEEQQPVLHRQNCSSNSNSIAFFTDEKIVIDFTCDERKEEVSLEYLQKMETLEEKLFEAFGKDKNQFKVRIQRDIYRKENRLLDCDTLEKVMLAWVNRQPLNVMFEPGN